MPEKPSQPFFATQTVRILTWLVAPVLIVIGGLWNTLGRVQAHQKLLMKEPASQFQAEETGRKPYALPGFSVQLEALQTDPIELPYQLFANPSLNSKGLEVQAGLKGSLPGGFSFAVEQLLPNAVDQGEVRDTPEAPENPALRVMLGVGTPEPLVGILFSRRGADGRFDAPGGRFSVLFLDAWTPDLLASLGPQPAKTDIISLLFLGQTLECPAKVGTSIELPPFSLKVVRAFPDFAVLKDGQGNPQPTSKSDQPRDPWVELALASPTGASKRVLLSARNPEVTDALNAPNLPQGLRLRYVRTGEDLQTRFVVFTRADQQVRLVEARTVRRTEPLALNRPFIVAPGFSVTPMQQLAHAKIVHRFMPHPDPKAAARFERPVLRLKVAEVGKGLEETVWLDSKGLEGSPDVQTLFGGRLRLAFRPRSLQPSDLKPVISVLDNRGRELARQEVGPNKPILYAGHTFTLSPNLPSHPGTINLQVIREPGWGWVYCGCALLLLGLIWQFLLVPWRATIAPR